MSIQMSRTSFLQMLAQSRLLSETQLRNLDEQLAGRTGVTARDICDRLVAREWITEWQAEKLLQARYRGFFLGPYRLLNRIARGGMSTIYAARHVDSGEVHALKVLPLARTRKASYLARFLREAEITQRLDHPHIVRVFGIYSVTDGQDPVHFMAMERLEGRDLAEIVSSEGPLPFRQAADLIRQAAEGLEYAHAAGLVHRDIKPGNLFLTSQQSIRILDLGLAQDFDSAENLTRDFDERVLGTADYLSPEQASDSHTVDRRADIYSLGCTLFFLLTGLPPFHEGTLVQRLVAHQTKTPPSVTEYRQDVPQPLLEILGEMMRKDRQDRIGSAAEVAEQLNAFLQQIESHSDHCIAILTPEPEARGSELPMTPTVIDDEVAFWQSVPQFSIHDSSAENLEGLVDAFPGLPEESVGEPDFSAILKSIEAQCGPGTVAGQDPRCQELLDCVRRLQGKGHPNSWTGATASRQQGEWTTAAMIRQPAQIPREHDSADRNNVPDQSVWAAADMRISDSDVHPEFDAGADRSQWLGWVLWICLGLLILGSVWYVISRVSGPSG